MAQPISLELPKRDPREELRLRLEQAPADHAEAVLAAFEVLQGLHAQGVLELLRGALGGGDRVLETVVDAVKEPEAIRGLRNLLILAKTLGSIDPELLKKFMESVPDFLTEAAKAQQAEPPGFWESMRLLRGRNLRRGIATANNLLGAMGKRFSD